MAKPQLNRPCLGWQRDLPGPNDPLDEPPMLLWQAPTHMDETYVEFARNTSSLRGVCFFFLPVVAWVLLDLFVMAAKDIYSFATTGVSALMAGIFLMLAGSISIGLWTAFVIYRAEISPPEISRSASIDYVARSTSMASIQSGGIPSSAGT